MDGVPFAFSGHSLTCYSLKDKTLFAADTRFSGFTTAGKARDCSAPPRTFHLASASENKIERVWSLSSRQLKHAQAKPDKMNKTITLLDGGMGQELVRRSGQVPTPLWSTRIMLDNPQLVEALHIDFIKAGARIITLNNYTATPARLARDATKDLLAPIHKAAIETAQSARRKSNISDVKIAGCLPPIMASYKPELAPDAQSCLAQYRELVAIQKDGIDLIFCETIATIREGVAAVTAAREAGFLTIASFTLDDDSPLNLRSGELLLDAVDAVAALGVYAVTVNCSMPETVDAAIPALARAFPIVGGYANGFQSIAALEAGGTTSGLKARKDLTPEAYAKHALAWVKAGAKIIGGCCEVGPEHIAEIEMQLKQDGYDIAAI